jgi:hypothetical protein
MSTRREFITLLGGVDLLVATGGTCARGDLEKDFQNKRRLQRVAQTRVRKWD